jgi:tetratricopeptide (TPR) repeat protein
MLEPPMLALPSFLRLRWITLVLAFVALASGLLVWRHRTAGPVLRVLILDAEVAGDGGVDRAQAAALNTLLKDLLEVRAAASVSLTPALPDPAGWDSLREDALVLRLAPRREQDRLQLGATWVRVADLRRERGWNRTTAAAAPPAAAFEALLAGLPLRGLKASPAQLLPSAPATFWDYLAARGGAPGGDYEAGRRLLEGCARVEPDCVAVHLGLGELHFFQALQAARNDTESLRAAEISLKRGLELNPHHPRGSWLLARLRTDTGRAKEALERLIESRRVHPHAMPLLVGITYAGRYAGLLDFAAAAETRTDELSADTAKPVRLQVTFLYSGDWDRFERTLWTRPGDITNSAVLVFRGQLELARGQREKALATFRELSANPVGYSQFIRLARVFACTLEQKPDEARLELDSLAEGHTGLRVPDGEFILNMAEAYVLLGDLVKGQDLAERAFYTGFTCARWYETNPLLQPLRGTPRWSALMQHVRERQAFLDARFPRSRWGL